MLEIQKYLLSGKSFTDLSNEFAVDVKSHPSYENLFLFKYDQIECSDRKLFSNKIVQECRGLILDEKNKWKVVARAFDKFFNHGEKEAAPIDWSSAKVLNKIDGSLCLVYSYDNKWQVATTGSADAGGKVNDFDFTFSELFWKTFKQMNGVLPNVNCQHCFMFELTSPFSRIVVNHKETKLTLLGSRNMETQEEMLASKTEGIFHIGIPVVGDFNLRSTDDLIKSFETMEPLEQEGYVVVDGSFHRIKVKHPGYVALHHAKDGMTFKAFVEIVRAGESSEVLTAFPEFKPMFDQVESKYEALARELQSDYDECSDITSQKEFAFAVAKSKMSSALFSLRAKKVVSIKQYLKEMRLDNLVSMLK